MVTAVGASTTEHVGSTGPGGGARGSKAGLQAQLQLYEKKLSDCVNCDSAKTTEGKAQIEELQGKVSATQARIKALDNGQTKPDNTSSVEATSTASASTRTDGPGRLVDTFA